MLSPAESVSTGGGGRSRRRGRASPLQGTPAPHSPATAPNPDSGAPDPPPENDTVLDVSLFASHPLMLERMRLQLQRPEHRVHAYLISPLDRSVPVEPLRQGVWVLDLHEPALLEQLLLRWRPPRPPLIAVGDSFEDAHAFQLLLLGARGLVRYDRMAGELVRAVQAVHAGAYWVQRMQMAHFVDHLLVRLPYPEPIAPLVALSPRERQVLDGLLARNANKEIAARMSLSERTVKFHVSNLLRKFGAASRHDLVWSMIYRPGDKDR